MLLSNTHAHERRDNKCLAQQSGAAIYIYAKENKRIKVATVYGGLSKIHCNALEATNYLQEEKRLMALSTG